MMSVGGSLPAAPNSLPARATQDSRANLSTGANHHRGQWLVVERVIDDVHGDAMMQAALPWGQ